MENRNLGALAALGEFFALPVAGDSWRPVDTLCGDAAILREYTSRMRAATATGFGIGVDDVPVRAAASSLHLSIVSRLLSPAVGAAACLSAVPSLTPDSVFWHDDSSHRPALGVSRVEWSPVPDAGSAAAEITAMLVDGVLRLLNTAMQQAVSLPPQVMWGNIASAANGAVTVLAQNRPGAEGFGRALVRDMIAAEPLLGTADVTDGRFRRRNCCLFYQVPGGGYCGDCVLVD
ncbi:(2Fe-2S)-binding protein [Mycolicibacterium smegmatis]|uniref:(2Fe-2S)-binding protein n=1 Tax=Mycolicibacterium smegmatis TaxID=1772 RepID=UPI001303680B|nr:(2Fe-2S)-binding protein [Mycolicibacterium smegmatis]